MPPVEIRVDRDSPHPGSIFTWKVESGEPPYLILRVPAHWLPDVVQPGYAVIDEHPVIQILERDDSVRPIEISTMVIGGMYDTINHGWHAWRTDVTAAVGWKADGPRVDTA